jgi:pentapeptide MXKDX repeat protein
MTKFLTLPALALALSASVFVAGARADDATNAMKPANAMATDTMKPATDAMKPANAMKPAADAMKPDAMSTEAMKPATDAMKPATDAMKPADTTAQ